MRWVNDNSDALLEGGEVNDGEVVRAVIDCAPDGTPGHYVVFDERALKRLRRGVGTALYMVERG